jgi:multidrug efflux pump subunit AcrA (membrane-fusion protein)
MRITVKNLLVLLVLLAVIPGFHAVAQFESPPANVRVARATMQMIAAQTLVPGTVVSRNDARLAAEVTGR